MNNPEKGYTLIEAVIAITLLAISISATAFWIMQGNHHRVQTQELKLALELADLYLAEVISTGRWDELSHHSQFVSGRISTQQAGIGQEEAARNLYDDCDDYHGFSASGNHTNVSGNSWGVQYQQFTVTINVYFADAAQLQATGAATNVKRIDVKVTWGSNQNATLSTLQTNS